MTKPEAPSVPPFPLKPRLAPLPRAEWTDPAREVFSFWGEPNSWDEGSKTNVMMVLARYPKLAMAFNQWSKHLLMANSLPVRQLEIVVLRVAWRVYSEYEWHNHVGYALKAGLSHAEIAALRLDVEAHPWNEVDAAVVRSVDDLLDKGCVSDGVWATLSKHFNTQQLMDLVFSIGHYVMTSWALSTFGVGLESPDPIGFDLKTKSGKTPGATYKPGETENWTSTRGY